MSEPARPVVRQTSMNRSIGVTVVTGLAAAILVGGCGGRGSGAQVNLGSIPTTPTSSAGRPTPVTHDDAASPVRTAAEIARRLLDQALVPPRAVPTQPAPTRSLRTPPEDPVTGGVVLQRRWWRIDEPESTAYRWIATQQSRRLTATGSTATGGPAFRDRTRAADFTERSPLPASVNSAQLSIEVVPLSAHSSAIGAFAVVVRQPRRPAIEDVPATVTSVSIVTRRALGQPSGAILARRVLAGAAARRTVRDFDALVVMPPGRTYACPVKLATTTVTFRADRRIWRAVVDTCAGVQVSVDGHRLPALTSSVRFGRDIDIVTVPPAIPGGGPAGPVRPARPIPVPTLQTTTGDRASS
jgi:hypothetical protein